jgi:hypothetical protein
VHEAEFRIWNKTNFKCPAPLARSRNQGMQCGETFLSVSPMHIDEVGEVPCIPHETQ